MMRPFMGTFACFVLGVLLLFLSACFDGNHNASTGLGEAPPASPTMIEFVTDLDMSWNPGVLRGMWRVESDDNRASGKVHTVSETQCPDRYRVVVTGATRSEKIYIDKTMYERNADGPWAVRPMQIHHMMLQQCGKRDAPHEDPARVRMLAEQFDPLDISGPVLRTIKGHTCREWTRKIQDFNSTLVLKTCYDVSSHATIQINYGEVVTTYDYDAAVDIKAPL
jgi:hypothetical protein